MMLVFYTALGVVPSPPFLLNIEKILYNMVERIGNKNYKTCVFVPARLGTGLAIMFSGMNLVSEPDHFNYSFTLYQDRAGEDAIAIQNSLNRPRDQQIDRYIRENLGTQRYRIRRRVLVCGYECLLGIVFAASLVSAIVYVDAFNRNGVDGNKFSKLNDIYRKCNDRPKLNPSAFQWSCLVITSSPLPTRIS